MSMSHRLVCMAALVLAPCGCNSSVDVARLRFESTMEAGVDFDRLQLNLKADDGAAPFYEATWEVGSTALPALPATVVLRRGEARRIHVTADALLKDFVVDRQTATVDFEARQTREVLLTFGPRHLCGNGRVDTGEACDCGTVSTASSRCEHPNSDSAPNACRTDCLAASCGDGVRDTDEECDDGNTIDTDACTKACRANRCGDGVVRHEAACFEEAVDSPMLEIMKASNLYKATFVADLNQDGRDDLITCCGSNSAAYGFHSLLGKGNGTFGEPLFHPSDPGPLAVGLFNGDPYPDVIALGRDSAYKMFIRVWQGQGDGRFTAKPGLEVSGFWWTAIVTGDVNGDGRLDAVYSKAEDRIPEGDPLVAIALGDGDGSLIAGPRITPSRPAVDLAIGDLNSDGIADLGWLMTVDSDSSAVELALGSRGNAPTKLPSRINTQRANAIEFLDVDADGHLDLVLVGDDVRLFKGDGAGGFAPIPAPVHSWLPPACAARTSDLDGDGIADLILSGPTIFFGKGGGTFASAQIVSIPHVAMPSCMGQFGLGDFDGDGHTDIATTACGKNGFSCPDEAVILLNRP